jgi:hypothetical protein
MAKTRLPDYPKRDDPLREPKLVKRNRIIKRQIMLSFRSVPVKRRVWWVTLTAVHVSRQEFQPCELPSSLTFEPMAFWCLSRRKARAILARDHAAGGSGTMYPVEYRLCAVCSRVLLGPDAHEYRMKQMKPAATWHFEQGPACNLACKPHGRGPNGQPTSYRQQATSQPTQTVAHSSRPGSL